MSWCPSPALPPQAPAKKLHEVLWAACPSLPLVGKSERQKSWNLAGAGWKTKCWDLLRKIMSSATKIKVSRVLKEKCQHQQLQPADAWGRSCLGEFFRLSADRSLAAIVRFCSLYAFRHFPHIVLRSWITYILHWVSSTGSSSSANCLVLQHIW